MPKKASVMEMENPQMVSETPADLGIQQDIQYFSGDPPQTLLVRLNAIDIFLDK